MLPCYPGFSASARPLPSCHTIAKQFYPFFKTSFDWLELFKNEITPYQIIIPIFFASCQTRLLILEIVVLDTFSPNCRTGSLIAVYTIQVLFFLQIVMDGIQSLDHLFCKLMYQILLWWNFTSQRGPYSENWEITLLSEGPGLLKWNYDFVDWNSVSNI